MVFLPNRTVDIAPEAERLYDDWLQSIDERLDAPDCDRRALCRTILTEVHFPHLVGVDPETLPHSTRVSLAHMDPDNVTLEPEYYSDIDLERYEQVKPLIWLWEMFDRSALGENVHLGVKFRRMLAKRIFRRCGRNFKAFHHVKLSFGYNLEVGDDVVVHRHVLLDDRGGIRLGNGASVSDFANIYSHSHDVVEGPEHHDACDRHRGRCTHHLSRHRHVGGARRRGHDAGILRDGDQGHGPARHLCGNTGKKNQGQANRGEGTTGVGPPG